MSLPDAPTGPRGAPFARLVGRMAVWSRARLAAVMLAVSEAGTLVIVCTMSVAFHGAVTVDYIATGVVAAAVVSLVVAAALTRLIAMLRDAERAATEASAAKSHFLASMSHEIRTPLHAMLGMAQILRAEGAAPSQLERLGTLEAAGEHLLRLVDAILDLARIEAGRFTLHVAPLRLEAVLARVAAMLRDRAASRGVRIVTEVDPRVGRVLGDATRLQQAALNYAANALRFTDAGDVTLAARLLDDAGDVAHVRVEVRDTGVGIAPEDLARLFAPFEQAGAASGRDAGTGLGLVITRHLAAMMGGEAGATSEPGVGSTFWFTARLPRATGVSEAPAPAPVERADETLRRRYAGRRVLLVEDEPVNREIGRHLLRAAGLSVDEAGDGAEAVARAAATRYALVLMDVQMPAMDGFEATRRIRASGASARAPVVAFTANVFAEDKARGAAAGVDDFITKPVDARVFHETVLRWIAQAR